MKKELVSQLSKNSELLNAIKHTNTLVLEKEIKKTKTIKDGCLTWREYLDFFFLTDKSLIGTSNLDTRQEWWLKVDIQGKRII